MGSCARLGVKCVRVFVCQRRTCRQKRYRDPPSFNCSGFSPKKCMCLARKLRDQIPEFQCSPRLQSATLKRCLYLTSTAISPKPVKEARNALSSNPRNCPYVTQLWRLNLLISLSIPLKSGASAPLLPHLTSIQYDKLGIKEFQNCECR